MDIQTLCLRIQMPSQVTDQVVATAKHLVFDELNTLSLLMDGENGLRGFQELTAELGNDPLGIKQLACQLYCACLRYNSYCEMGIPDRIYYDTMSCYTRFVTECLYYKGGYQFDRGWWTWRQLSMRVFRLGQLEYELKPEGTVAIHIPTGSKIVPENVDQSLAEARCFIRRFFPAYTDAIFTCNSWLLSPALASLLTEGSNILSFQRRFTLTQVDSEPMDYISWLFQRLPDELPVNLPENTSLQRKVKAYILNGGKIGSAAGYLVTDKEFEI